MHVRLLTGLCSARLSPAERAWPAPVWRYAPHFCTLGPPLTRCSPSGRAWPARRRCVSSHRLCCSVCISLTVCHSPGWRVPRLPASGRRPSARRPAKRPSARRPSARHPSARRRRLPRLPAAARRASAAYVCVCVNPEVLSAPQPAPIPAIRRSKARPVSPQRAPCLYGS